MQFVVKLLEPKWRLHPFEFEYGTTHEIHCETSDVGCSQKQKGASQVKLKAQGFGYGWQTALQAQGLYW